MDAVAARHGPCLVTGSAAVNNPFSWNNEVNMLYIDQPIGTGFSYGTAPTPKTTDEAAQDVWKFLQVFFQHPKFEKYQSRNLGIWTESYVQPPSQHILATTHFHNFMFPSYGGHYGPRFSASVFPIFSKKNEHLSTGFKLHSRSECGHCCRPSPRRREAKLEIPRHWEWYYSKSHDLSSPEY